MSYEFDNTAYGAAYLDSIRTSVGLENDVLTRLSIPMFSGVTQAYRQSKVKVMILGQETAGEYTPLLNIKPDEARRIAIAGWTKFDMAVNQPQYNSPYWRAFREICQKLDLESPYGAAWCNLFKVQRIHDKNTASIRRFTFQQQKQIQAWQQRLFEAEMEFFNPDHVICLTGPYYDHALQESVPDLKLAAMTMHPQRQLASGHSTRFNCQFVRTYHPGYLQRAKKWTFIKHVCETIKIKLNPD
ncbi:MAG: hypothetical protein K2X57_28770 [Xanthobacteraceae bacterium]|nr:hypothetical protein [Xanthobacteraceae bacterium]